MADADTGVADGSKTLAEEPIHQFEAEVAGGTPIEEDDQMVGLLFPI